MFFVCILVVVIWASCGMAALPPVMFNSVSSINGLPQNSGRALLQDSDGYIWVGTEDGLVRFDGESMLAFRKNYDDPATLSDNYINALAEDGYGRIWVGTMGGGLNIIDRQRSNITRFPLLEKSDISHLFYHGSSKTLFIATGEGLYSLDVGKYTEKFAEHAKVHDSSVLIKPQILSPDGTPYNGLIQGVTFKGDEIWFCTRGSGVGRYELTSKSTKWFQKGEAGLEDDTFNTIFCDAGGVIWLGSQNKGLVRCNISEGAILFSHYHRENSTLKSNDVMAIADAQDGNLWVGTWKGGLSLFTTANASFNSFPSGLGDQYSLPSDIVMSIYPAKNNQIWVGTFDKGISWFDPDSAFHVYRTNPKEEHGLGSNIVWSFASEDTDGLWVGTSNGLSKLNLATNSYTTPQGYTPQQLWRNILEDDIRALQAGDGELWIAAKKHGVFRVTLEDGVVTPLSDIAGSGEGLTHPYIRLIHKDSYNAIWFGATKGLNRLDPVTGNIRQYMVDEKSELSLPHYRIRSIFEDSRGQIWVGTSNGLLLLDRDGKPKQVFKYETRNDGLVLAGKGVRGGTEDNLGRIWLATEGGISIYDPTEKTTTVLREKNGLPSNATYCAVRSGGYMWVSTLHGLARIDPKSFDIEKYTTDDGLPDNEFNFNAWHRIVDGRLALGTLSGYTLFSPSKVPGPERKDTTPPLFVTPFTYDKGNLVRKDHQQNETIELDWTSNKIFFTYGVLNFGKISSVRYEFKLQGQESVWTNNEYKRFVSFTGLAPGNYKFVVRAKDSHGQWQHESSPVEFSVAQVPWKTVPAYLFYVVLLCSTLVLGFFLYNKRVTQRSVYLEELVARRTAELKESNTLLIENHNKLDHLLASRERLFRAVAHELRTPLAVIMSSIESLQSDRGEKSDALDMVYNRTAKMGDLIDNLLEISNKSPRGGEHKERFLLGPALREAVAPFFELADQEDKVIRETYGPAVATTCLVMNRVIFIMMVSNLVANALKFTKKNGNIQIHCTQSEGEVEIVVDDDGVGVEEDGDERIFNWFERGSSGSTTKGWGLGLAFVKDEVEAAGGSVELRRDGKPGATFRLALPCGEETDEKAVQLETPLTHDFNKELLPAWNPEKEYTLLIVEDDGDLLHRLTALFPDHWKKITSVDAETGITLAYEHQPDIVITDLLLPGESGFGLTRKLKNNPETGHIPIIILTALEGEENRLTGLGLSADSFLGKPFSNEELRLRVGGLLANRESVLRRTRQLIQQSSEKLVKSVSRPEQSFEKEFLAKLDRVFCEDQDFVSLSLEDAAKELAMSKRSLQREMERAGISWREYKLFRRMKVAMELLSGSDKRVGEIAELTGYSSVAHFSRTFKDVTGKSPSEWRKTSE